MSDSPVEQVVVTSRSFGSGTIDAVAALEAEDVTVRRGPADHEPAALHPLLENAFAWIAGASPVTAAHLEAAPRLRLVARYGTGVDAVDLKAAQRRGIAVTNTPGANARAVAEHTIALMLACLRHVVDGDRRVRSGSWTRLRGEELAAATVGVIGLGAIGRRVAQLARGFGAEVLAHDPFARADGDAQDVDLDELVGRSTVVTLHRPPGDRPLIDADFVARLIPGTTLINTARAALVDAGAVAAALEGGQLGAYGADVLDGETGGSVLLRAPRTVLTPHCGAHTTQAVDRMSREAADEVIRCHLGRPLRHPVTRESQAENDVEAGHD